jgi:hypothetical protein
MRSQTLLKYGETSAPHITDTPTDTVHRLLVPQMYLTIVHRLLVPQMYLTNTVPSTY